MRRRSGMMQSPQAYVSRSGYLKPDIGQWRVEPQRNAGVRRTVAGEIAVKSGRYAYPAIMIAAGRMELQPGQISGDLLAGLQQPRLLPVMLPDETARLC